MSNQQSGNSLPVPFDADFAKSTLYKLHLAKLNPQQRALQKNNVVDSKGFLTPEGAMIYLDSLWQRDEKGQAAIADELIAMDKEAKKEKKSKEE